MDIHQLLIQISNGKSSFHPETESTEDMQTFQNLVDLIRDTERLGYIKIKLHTEHETGHDYFDSVHINEITEKGLDFIKNSKV